MPVASVVVARGAAARSGVEARRADSKNRALVFGMDPLLGWDDKGAEGTTARVVPPPYSDVPTCSHESGLALLIAHSATVLQTTTAADAAAVHVLVVRLLNSTGSAACAGRSPVPRAAPQPK